MNRTAPCGRRASCYVPVRLALRPPPEQPIAIGRTRHRRQARVGTLLGDEPIPIDVLYDTDRAQRLARLQQMPLFGRRPMCREDYRQADGTEPARKDIARRTMPLWPTRHGSQPYPRISPTGRTTGETGSRSGASSALRSSVVPQS